MKIIIIGCGKVGIALAEGLTQENHDVTIIDSSAERMQDVTEELDAMPIVGNGSSINTLLEAGAADTDLIIAVTAVYMQSMAKITRNGRAQTLRFLFHKANDSISYLPFS